MLPTVAAAVVATIAVATMATVMTLAEVEIEENFGEEEKTENLFGPKKFMVNL